MRSSLIKKRPPQPPFSKRRLGRCGFRGEADYCTPSRFSSSRILASSSTVALGMGKVPALVAAMPRRRQASLMTGRKGL